MLLKYKKKVENLVKRFKTRDPFTIAKELGIIIKYKNLSSDFPKGMFQKHLRRKFIILNMNRIYDENELRMVMAHEFGHAILHSDDIAFFLHDHTFYSRGRFEREANAFAAELLIDTNLIDEVHMKNYSINQLACFYSVPAKLIKIKFNIN
ncbi:ImmA/IrrE family metallo-endopeptidase [Clostridium butyricum]|uniref:ImmA/IrrE family metallo-endopeptidase n=1 Tax=Clostridium butyricum TaxID=1492 RepID=UPI002ABE13B0|nr:ImmA/IrrE family metallo-endopeptidase [Clostridium butyricum]